MAIVLAAATMRPPIVAVGPLAVNIQQDTRLGTTAISLLTGVPLVILGVVAAMAAPLARRLGGDHAVTVALSLIVFGIVLRLPNSLWAVFAGTLVAAGGIALGNVLVPAAIKEHAPSRLALLMALYSVALQTGATSAVALTIPIQSAFEMSWRAALGVWGLLAAAALMAWLPRTFRPGTRAPAPQPLTGIWRSSLGWSAGVFCGLTSLLYYAAVAWMPALLQDHGLSARTAGYASSVVGIGGMVGGLLTSIFRRR
ncbi:MFS transporter [Mycobacterium kansasii]